MTSQERQLKVSIIGTVGVPAAYGGFETLAENLVRYHYAAGLPHQLTVYCSAKNYSEKTSLFLSSQLIYLPLSANGMQSIPYDMLSLVSSVKRGSDVILLLGVSGALFLPLMKLFSSARVITNIDGIEWRRGKWKGLSRLFLRLSERFAVRYSDEIIADNEVIAEYLRNSYSRDCQVIAYGGDHALRVKSESIDEYCLPGDYAFSVCRIEPENNIHLIVEAFAKQTRLSLVIVGNWNNSEYGIKLRAQYADIKHFYLLDSIYDLGKLKTLRLNARLYVHGHSAGGTNPSLVEAMHFAHPILAYDCSFNRATTEDKALYFKSSEELSRLIEHCDVDGYGAVGADLAEIAARRYTWDAIARQYFLLLKAA